MSIGNLESQVDDILIKNGAQLKAFNQHSMIFKELFEDAEDGFDAMAEIEQRFGITLDEIFAESCLIPTQLDRSFFGFFKKQNKIAMQTKWKDLKKSELIKFIKQKLELP